MNKASRLSYSLVEETCPLVDELSNEMISDILELLPEIDSDKKASIQRIINNTIDSIKSSAIIRLRSELTNKCRDVLELNEELSHNKMRLEDIEREIF